MIFILVQIDEFGLDILNMAIICIQFCFKYLYSVLVYTNILFILSLKEKLSFVMTKVTIIKVITKLTRALSQNFCYLAAMIISDKSFETGHHKKRLVLKGF